MHGLCDLSDNLRRSIHAASTGGADATWDGRRTTRGGRGDPGSDTAARDIETRNGPKGSRLQGPPDDDSEHVCGPCYRLRGCC